MGLDEEVESIFKSAKTEGLTEDDLKDVLGLPVPNKSSRRSINILSLLVLLVAIVWGGLYCLYIC